VFGREHRVFAARIGREPQDRDLLAGERGLAEVPPESLPGIAGRGMEDALPRTPVSSTCFQVSG